MLYENHKKILSKMNVDVQHIAMFSNVHYSTMQQKSSTMAFLA